VCVCVCMCVYVCEIVWKRDSEAMKKASCMDGLSYSCITYTRNTHTHTHIHTHTHKHTKKKKNTHSNESKKMGTWFIL
jgi:hypothetical protein